MKVTTSGGSKISRGTNPEGGANMLFEQFFSKTAWKWRNFGRGGMRPRPLDPPITTSSSSDIFYTKGNYLQFYAVIVSCS